MRISDWSSDVCSSDLPRGRSQGLAGRSRPGGGGRPRAEPRPLIGAAAAWGHELVAVTSAPMGDAIKDARRGTRIRRLRAELEESGFAFTGSEGWPMALLEEAEHAIHPRGIGRAHV